jgi:hypothetical protein
MEVFYLERVDRHDFGDFITEWGFGIFKIYSHFVPICKPVQVFSVVQIAISDIIF